METADLPSHRVDSTAAVCNYKSGYTDGSVGGVSGAHESMPATAEIFDDLSTLSDATRSRMLLLLERHELTVSELCTVLQLPQSTVSRHLKTLADDDWVASRRDGTSRFYSMPVDDLDSGARRLWPLIREQVASTTGASQDDRRLRGVLTR